MKKFFSILALVVATAAPLAADFTNENPALEGEQESSTKMVSSTESESSSDEDKSEEIVHAAMMKDMKHFVNKVRGKVISLPGSLEKEGMQLKADMFRLLADSLRECGKLNYAKSSQGKKYEQAAQKVEAAADALESLPYKETMKKSFKRIGDWLKLMVKKKEFKARFIKEVAKTLGDEEMEQRADKYITKIEKLKSSFKELVESKEANGEEAEEEEEEKQSGCPLKLSEESTEASNEEEAEEEEEENL